MAFQFRLAVLLRLSESLERQEERALQVILMEIAQICHQMQQAREAILDARQTWLAALTKTTHAVHLQSMLENEQSLVRDWQALLQRLEVLNTTRERQLARYQEAHQNHEKLRAMRADHRSEYDHAQARAQQKLLDDIFAARTIMRSAGQDW